MEHFYQNIQGWFEETSQGEIYRIAVAAAPYDDLSVFVELGSWKGKSAAFMAVEIINSGKPIKFFCVDHFLGSDELPHILDPDLPHLRDIFEANVGHFDFVRVLPHDSLIAADCFGKGEIDMLFIDASHKYEDVKADLAAWEPKLRPNAILAGDDFSWPGVWRAVRERYGLSGVRRMGGAWVRR